MIYITDKNKTIYKVIYTSITSINNIKILKEFGFFTYCVYPESNDDGILNCK